MAGNYKHLFLKALDGVDRELDALALEHHGKPPLAEGEIPQDVPATDAGEKPVAGIDPHTGEMHTEKVQYEKGHEYEGKDQQGGRSGHPFGARGNLFGKRFAR